LTRLKTDYLDNLALHGLNTPQHLELVTKKDGCMLAVQEAIDAGAIRHVGFSTHGSLELILDLIETDLFEFANVHYYYFNQRNAAAVQRAYEKDMGVFIISPTDKGGQLYAPSEKLKILCQPFTPLGLNHRFLLSDPRIHTLSLGAASPEEFAAPMTVADQGMALTPEEQQALERIDQVLVDLKPNLCEQCFACLPCPENINIPEVLRLRNLAVGLDMVDFGQYRYNMFEKAGHWFWGTKGNRCTDCGDCLPRCPVNLPIPTLLRDTHQRLAAGERKRLWED
jgi:predicted aldo/keto reductase-like oxidoreductase